jgi:hypothetical protein
VGSWELEMGAPPAQGISGVRAVSRLSVIAARKVDFANNAIHRLTVSSNAAEGRAPTADEIQALLPDLVKVIGELDWRLLVSEAEASNERLDLNTRLEDLNLDAICEEIERRLGRKLRPD